MGRVGMPSNNTWIWKLYAQAIGSEGFNVYPIALKGLNCREQLDKINAGIGLRTFCQVRDGDWATMTKVSNSIVESVNNYQNVRDSLETLCFRMEAAAQELSRYQPLSAVQTQMIRDIASARETLTKSSEVPQ